MLGHPEEPQQVDAPPGEVDAPEVGLGLGELLLGVVDEGGQLVPVGPGNGGPQQLVDLHPHHAGGGVQDVLEGLELSVNVG